MFNRLCASNLSHFTADKLEEIKKQAEKMLQTEMEYGDLLAHLLKSVADSMVYEYIFGMQDEGLSQKYVESNLSDLATGWMETRDELNSVLDEMADGHDDAGLELLVLMGLVLERLDRLKVGPVQPKISLVVDNSKKVSKNK